MVGTPRCGVTARV